MRSVGILVGLIVLVLILGLLFTAFTSAQANLAAAQAVQVQAQTGQFQALALLAGQCLSVVAVVLALVVGAFLGMKAQSIKTQTQALRQVGNRRWVSGPDAGWKMAGGNPQHELPEGDLLTQLLWLEMRRRQAAAPRLPGMEITEVNDDEDENDWNDYQGWGW